MLLEDGQQDGQTGWMGIIGMLGVTHTAWQQNNNKNDDIIDRGF